MDITTVTGIGSTIVFILGWLMKRAVSQLDDKILEHEKEIRDRSHEINNIKIEFDEKLNSFRIHCAETFVTTSALEKAIDRFTRSLDAVFKKLDGIDIKLDTKLDREVYYRDDAK